MQLNKLCALAVCLAVLGPGLALSSDDEIESLVASIDGPAPPAAPEVVSRDPDGKVTLRAIALETPITLDGRLEENIYRRVPSISGFVQQEPHEGQPATEKTEVWVFFDDENIYVSARNWDTHPEKIVANERRCCTALAESEIRLWWWPRYVRA